MAGRCIVPVLLILAASLAPALAADGSSHIPDPAGDQEFDTFLTSTTPPLLGCTNPSSDVIDVESAANAQRIVVTFVFLDPDSPVLCNGVALPDLQHTEYYPSHRFSLSTSAGTLVNGLLHPAPDGGSGWELCLTYPAPTLRVCTPQATAAIELPTFSTLPDGRTVDVRGLALRVSATAADSYGTSDPKSNFLMFWDETTPPPGYPLQVPAS